MIDKAVQKLDAFIHALVSYTTCALAIAGTLALGYGFVSAILYFAGKL